MDDAKLRTVWQLRQFDDQIVLLGQPLGQFVKDTLAKRVRQLGELAEIWDELIPAGVRDHTALESLNRGVLTVLVDSAARRYELRMLLDGGLRRQILSRFRGTINKVRLLPGKFDAVEV